MISRSLSILLLAIALPAQSGIVDRVAAVVDRQVITVSEVNQMAELHFFARNVGESEDDYRHRMKMNLLALVVTILLVVSGVWIAETIAEMRKIQDCFLAGGRNCAPIAVPPVQRG